MTTSKAVAKVPMRRGQSPWTRSRRLASSASNSNAVDMENYQGTIYFADIVVDGSTFVVQVDTGSSDLWISCYYLSGSTCSSTCPSDASTISYGSGDVCVEGTSADIKFGNVAVSDYVVGVAQGSNVNPSSSSSLLAGDAEGLFGLAYGSLATLPSPGGQFIDYVTSFSMYLTKEDNSDGSFLLLNGVDDELISSNGLMPYTVDLKSSTPTHWTIGMTAMQIGNNSAVFPCSTASSGSCDSIVDSGTSLLAMPSSVYSDFVSTYLSGCQQYSSGSEIYMCSSDVDLPRLALTFGDVTFYLEKDDYIIDLGANMVVVEVQATSSSSGSYANTWIIGETFLKTFYTSYNVNESVTFYCVENSTCTPGSQAVSLPASSDSSGDNTGGGGFGSGSDGTSGTLSSDDKSHLVTILAIVLGVLAFFFIIAVVTYLFRCICRRKRASRHEQSLQPVLVVPGGYYQPQPAVQPSQGYYAQH
ncbi:pepsin-like aspartic protease A1 [Phytophthora sojae]|uniref:Pepsin-like aspartic protease A1 n=1 Tax=Phytophthora sojae (strain P6497) TaxID=1094619 RepID=G4ZYQ0_PHYSP|nr:pepsin-like aspartic protease A1 [Phytophthora sojae]EGZ12083.1 pepsin-like aspartic protease A1 [Phytophthora sojae]|eukprot:XP_009532416.1 pepsin-like aspartic protease A1 [Phytophthora sojae]